MGGFTVRPAKATAQQRRNAWESAKRWGVDLKCIYNSQTEAEADAKRATDLSGIRFEVIEAELPDQFSVRKPGG